VQADWPQFRGPDGQGHADAREVPTTWSETENVVWKTPIPGKGWSSPVVQGDQVWMTTSTEEGLSLRAVCVQSQTGELLKDIEIFRLKRAVPVNSQNSPASPSPILEPGRLYVNFGTSGSACIDTQTGEILWKNQELPVDHKEGPGSTPLIFGDLMIVNCDGMDVQFVVALNKNTGEVVWKVDRTGLLPMNPDFRKAYATCLIVMVNGQPQLISPAAERVIAYNPHNGAEIWRVDYRGFSNASRPIFGHDMIYICTGYPKSKMLAIRTGGEGDLTQSHVAWSFGKQVPNKSSPLLVGDFIFFHSDGGIATCLNAKTGEDYWTERLTGNFSASPLSAAGKVFFFGEDGKTTVIEPGPEFKVVSINQLAGRFMASAAVDGRALILRTDRHLYRIENSARTAGR